MNYHYGVSEEIYHRVYRLLKRNTDPPLIAAALNLPLRIVLGVIGRLEKKPELAGARSKDGDSTERETAPSLEATFSGKARYALLQLAGHVVKEQKMTLENELRNVQESVWKAVAIRLADVEAMDETGARMLLEFCESMIARERYVALLDPSVQIEPMITQFQFEGKVPVFGTIGAFENGVISYRPASSSRQKNRPKPR